MKPKKEFKAESFVIPAEVQDDIESKEGLDEIVEISQELDLYDDQVKEDELEVAKLLKGSAEHFELDANLIDRLVRHGIAAKTEEGLMRGYKWDQFVK